MTKKHIFTALFALGSVIAGQERAEAQVGQAISAIGEIPRAAVGATVGVAGAAVGAVGEVGMATARVPGAVLGADYRRGAPTYYRTRGEMVRGLPTTAPMQPFHPSEIDHARAQVSNPEAYMLNYSYHAAGF